jgi:hypothetical protein
MREKRSAAWGRQFVKDTTGSKVGESLEKETFVEVAKQVGGDRRVSIRNGQASVQRCRRTLTKRRQAR